MADLDKIFKAFNSKISITSGKKGEMRSAKDAVKKVITEYFSSKDFYSVPKFYIQGSYKMGTMIIKEDGTYDIDLGVFFNSVPEIEPNSIMQNVQRAVADQTLSGAQHKKKCIRLLYKGKFNMDLPVYYHEVVKEKKWFKKVEVKKTMLATKDGWEESDPRLVVGWFEAIENRDQQKRLIKYLKAWANHHPNKMPSGIALTVLAVKCFQYDIRDDVSLYNTLHELIKIFNWFGIIKNTDRLLPVSPQDDLFDRMDRRQIKVFKEAIEKLYCSLGQAIDSDSETQAIKLLSKHFGKRFLVS